MPHSASVGWSPSALEGRAVGHTSTDRRRGRIEERTLKVVTVTEQAGGLGFPHAAQAIQVIRRTRRSKPKPGTKNRWRVEIVYGVVTLPAEQASPAELANGCASTGTSRTSCTGSATSPSVKISKPQPATAPTSWPSYTTSPSPCCAWPATTTSHSAHSRSLLRSPYCCALFACLRGWVSLTALGGPARRCRWRSPRWAASPARRGPVPSRP
jgi:hypothetical protein